MRHWWRRIRRESAVLAAFAIAGLLVFGMAQPVSAQLFDFGFGQRRPVPPRGVPQGGGGFFPSFRDGGGFFGGDRAPAQPQQPRADYSRPPAPEKRETPAEQNVLVIGDAMADWLAYGLEDALAETPELGIIRKAKTVSGLIRYQPKGEPSDWAAAAKEILASEHPDVIVVMLGLHDRIPIHEKVEKTDKDKKKGKKDAKPDANKPEANKADANKPGEGENVPPEAASSDDEEDAAPSEKTSRSVNGIADFRDPRWVELYNRKIEELIGILKAKGAPVLWVGLPAVRGTKSTSDMLFLDALYRDAAAKAGITYVDVWDGFVDDGGRYIQQGPDFEGQIRRLRSYDGVFFTKAGARKLAHYTEREIRRVLAARSAPLSLPNEAPDNSVHVKPGDAASPRPLAGPVVPLVASSVSTDQLLGGAGARPAAVDALAARTLVKGEPLSAPAGRADDGSWPRREIGKLEAPPTPGSNVATLDGEKPAAPKPKRRAPQANSNNGFFDPGRMMPQRPRPIAPSAASSGFFFFR